MKISVLFLAPPTESQPESLAHDLNLDKLLSAGTISRLLTVCTPDERRARVLLFRALENPEVFASMLALSDSLTALSQASTAQKNTQTQLEGLILSRELCASTLEALDRLEDFITPLKTNPLMSRIGVFLDENRNTKERLSEAVSSTENDVELLSGLELSTAMKLSKQSHADSLQERLCELIKGMGIDALPKKRSLRLTPELSNGYSRLLPETFSRLSGMDSLAVSIVDELLPLRYEIESIREIISLQRKAIAAGFSVAMPVFTEERRFKANNACDISLLVKNEPPIPNDIDFDETEPVSFITGANGGGKTTYLRCVASNLLFALAGCRVFAESALVGGFDRIRAHFPADETFTDSGRLVEEMQRVGSILERSDKGSFVFMNETYSGTDDIKGAKLTLETARKLRDSGAFALWVTHFHEVNEEGFGSLTTVINENDSSKRTFRIVKRRGGGSSFAVDILKKYHLDRESLEATMNTYAMKGQAAEC